MPPPFTFSRANEQVGRSRHLVDYSRGNENPIDCEQHATILWSAFRNIMDAHYN